MQKEKKMKVFKKLFSIVLAVTMIMAMSVTAFATESQSDPTATTGSIKVTNAPEGVGYNVYKIFDADTPTYGTGEDAPTDVIYTIKDSSPWFGVVKDYPGLILTPVYIPDHVTNNNIIDYYEVTWGTGFIASEFAEKLKLWLNHNPSIDTIASTESYEISNGEVVIQPLNPGYYLVAPKEHYFDQNGGDITVYSLTTVFPNEEVVIQNKNDMPLDKTVDGVKYEGAQVGDTVTFQIKSKVPSVSWDDTYYAYRLSDTMSDGLRFNEDVVVWIDYNNNGELDEGQDPYDGSWVSEKIDLAMNPFEADPLEGDQIRYNSNGKNFELSLDMLNRGKKPDPNYPEYEGLAGMDIYIEYTATVTQEAIASLEVNYAVLQYGNDPKDLLIKDSKAWVYDAQIIIDKFETGNASQKLKGAKFVLYTLGKKIGQQEISANNYKKDVDYIEIKPEPGSYDNITYQEKLYYIRENVYVAFSDVTDCERYIEENSLSGWEFEGGSYYPVDEENNMIIDYWETSWGHFDDAYVVETDENGAARFTGLEDGKYFVEEIEAPVDYVMLDAPIEVVIDGTDCLTPGLTEGQIADILTSVLNINNTPGTSLPTTGGIGTTIFYVIGALLVIAGGVVLITRRRMSA
jgi:fimbrial isopeptide formation D2 family protein/LPXTG-motif cell wall-anchored protein